jgi:hypothetical protein
MASATARAALRLPSTHHDAIGGRLVNMGTASTGRPDSDKAASMIGSRRQRRAA